MAISLAVLAKNAKLNAITTYAGGSALLRIYDSTVPATADTALGAQVLLAELTMNATFAPAASGGVLTANAITQDSSANATGTATFFRIYQSNGTTVVAQGTVGTSGADLNMNTTSIVSGGPVAVSSLVWTEGN